MARSIQNIITYGASGLLGNVVFRQVRGKVFICKRPEPTDKPPSAAQLACRERFSKAQRYAGAAIRTPHLKAYYSTGGDSSAYHAALRDAMEGPEIRSIRPGQTIGINARDNFKVQSVWVVIVLANGELWEEGAAVQTHTFEWTYAVKRLPVADAVLYVSATDLAGNITQEAVNMPAGGPVCEKRAFIQNNLPALHVPPTLNPAGCSPPGKDQPVCPAPS